MALADARSGYVTVLGELSAAIAANLAGTLDDRDPEFLHDFRVAVRRTRSILKSADGVIEGQARKKWRDDFGWLGELTSPPRDIDVLTIEWPGYLALLDPDRQPALGPVANRLAKVRAREHRRLVKGLRGKRYRRLMRDWDDWLASDPPVKLARLAGRPLGEVVVSRIERAQHRVVQLGRNVSESSPDSALHDVRKAAKELRYLLECFGPILAPGPAKAFVKELKDLQTNLGSFNDTAVHLGLLRTISDPLHLDAGGAAAVSELIVQLEQRHAAARAAFGDRFAAFEARTGGADVASLVR